MRVYPLLSTVYDKYGHKDTTIVVEVFDSYDAAYDYALSIISAQIEYGDTILPERAVDYEGKKLNGYINVYGESGNIVEEFTLWAEPVRSKGWHA